MTRKQFRRWLLIGVGLSLTGFIGESASGSGLSDAEKILVEWNYYGALLPDELVLGVFSVGQVFYWLGLIGFLLFQPIGRSLFLVGNCFIILGDPFLGWAVYAPFWSGLRWIGADSLLVALGLSYFPPHSALFGDRQDPVGGGG